MLDCMILILAFGISVYVCIWDFELSVIDYWLALLGRAIISVSTTDLFHTFSLCDAYEPRRDVYPSIGTMAMCHFIDFDYLIRT